jgi:hypothetical protein
MWGDTPHGPPAGLRPCTPRLPESAAHREAMALGGWTVHSIG